MTSASKYVIVARIVAATIASAGVVSAAHAQVAGQNASERLAFVSVRDGNREIYVMNGDGSGVTNLTGNPAQDDNPAWSPDGTRIAFDSDRTGATELFLMNADGGKLTQLTHDASIDTGPRWSPDGTRIAFASNRDGHFQIYVVRADGTGLSRLTSGTASDLSPSWSPDGLAIAFRSDRANPGNGQIFVMSAAGTNVTPITFGAGDHSDPSWSPNGARIAFSTRVGVNAGLYAVNTDGSALTNITPGDADATAPAWSLDGASLAFSSNRNGNYGVCVVVVASGATRCLTQNGDTRPSWATVPAEPPRSPVISWANPLGIVLGTALGAAQLNATADAAGRFTYTPPIGTILPLGAAQRLSVVFTPDDPVLNGTATAVRAIDVISGSATPAGMFVGRVTDARTSMPLDSIGVWMYDASGNFSASTRTGADGTYASPLLSPGAYYVRTFNNWAYIDELYDDVTCLADCVLARARAVTVLAGATATGVDFVLEKGFGISGHVRDSSTNAPLENVSVDILDEAGTFISSSWTSSSGTYTSTGLPAGSYRARTSNERGYQEMLYASVACIAKRCDARTGTPIPVGPTDQPANVDFALDIGGRVTGAVRHVSGAALANVRVQIFTAAGAFVASATTSGAGSYVTTALPAGMYRSRTVNRSGYVDALFGGPECSLTCDVTTGSLITVTVGVTTPNVDFQLAMGSAISGRVLTVTTAEPLASVVVELDNATGISVAHATTAADGVYAFTGLPAGAYFARTSNAIGYRDKIYNNVRCPASYCRAPSGDAIIVADGSVRTGVDFILDNRAATAMIVTPVHGSYGQTVTLSAALTAAGAPVVNRIVSFTVNGAPAGSAATNTAGGATLEHVPLGASSVRLYSGGVTAAFAGDLSYESATGGAELVVARAAPLLAWSQPSAILYGTPLGLLQLNATASVPGTFVYRPSLNTILPVGAAQTLTVMFSPADPSNYASVSGAVTITVGATPPPQPTFQVLHNFTGADGANPHSVLTDASNGSFYGTTSYGGPANAGVLYRIDTDGVVAPTYAFNWGGGGAIPTAGVTKGTDGYFYGTTSGTVYRADANGALVSLREFTGSTGTYPSGGVIQAADGYFYGTAAYGGGAGVGTVYRLDTANALTVLHSFSWAEGAYPFAGLVQGSDGFLYGTTAYGGSNGAGTVYRMDASGALTVLHSFSWSDGAYPDASLVEGTDGNFYGSTSSGGPSSAGTTFRIDPAGKTTVLHTFAWNDGASPVAGVIQGSDGFFYGITSIGGRLGAGTVYRMDASGTVTTLHEFMWTDGANPSAGLTETQVGVFYGTTYIGGANGVGTAFRMTRFAGTGPSQVQVLAESATYGGTTNLSFKVSSANVPLSGELVTFAIDGIPAGAATTGADGVATMRQVTVAGIGAGTHRIDAAFLGDARRAGATGLSFLVIAPATPTVVWWPGGTVYGTAVGRRQLNASANVPGAFTYTLPKGTLLPVGLAQPLSVLFTPADTMNYATVSATRTITVDKAAPRIVWNVPSAIPADTPLGASQLNAVANVPGTFEYSPGVGAVLPAGPGQTLTVTFTPTDRDNYVQQTATTKIDIPVPEQVAGDEQIGWAQKVGGRDIASVRFALYVDGTRIELGVVSCITPAVADVLSCSARLPSIAPGTRRLELASFTVEDTAIIESSRSDSLFVTVAPPVQNNR